MDPILKRLQPTCQRGKWIVLLLSVFNLLLCLGLALYIKLYALIAAGICLGILLYLGYKEAKWIVICLYISLCVDLLFFAYYDSFFKTAGYRLMAFASLGFALLAALVGLSPSIRLFQESQKKD